MRHTTAKPPPRGYLFAQQFCLSAFIDDLAIVSEALSPVDIADIVQGRKIPAEFIDDAELSSKDAKLFIW